MHASLTHHPFLYRLNWPKIHCFMLSTRLYGKVCKHRSTATRIVGRAMSSSVSHLLKHAKEVVDECLADEGSHASLDWRVVQDRLNPVLFAALSAGRNRSAKLPEEDRADLWHIVCKLWVSRSLTNNCNENPRCKSSCDSNLCFPCRMSRWSPETRRDRVRNGQ